MLHVTMKSIRVYTHLDRVALVPVYRLTGGEPTVRPDLVQLCHGLSGLDGLETLAMTSNGIKLERQLPDLKAAGEMSVSSLVYIL